MYHIIFFKKSLINLHFLPLTLLAGARAWLFRVIHSEALSKNITNQVPSISGSRVLIVITRPSVYLVKYRSNGTLVNLKSTLYSVYQVMLKEKNLKEELLSGSGVLSGPIFFQNSRTAQILVSQKLDDL